MLFLFFVFYFLRFNFLKQILIIIFISKISHSGFAYGMKMPHLSLKMPFEQHFVIENSILNGFCRWKYCI